MNKLRKIQNEIVASLESISKVRHWSLCFLSLSFSFHFFPFLMTLLSWNFLQLVKKSSSCKFKASGGVHSVISRCDCLNLLSIVASFDYSKYPFYGSIQ